MCTHTDTLWRKCKTEKNGDITATRNVIGKNTIGGFGPSIAAALGFSQDEAKRFTGHWVRRTSLTWAANAGQTTQQMMALSGHVSATVVQRYVSDNDTMRLSNAAAVSIGGGSHSRPRSPSPEDDSTSSVRHAFTSALAFVGG